MKHSAKTCFNNHLSTLSFWGAISKKVHPLIVSSVIDNQCFEFLISAACKRTLQSLRIIFKVWKKTFYFALYRKLKFL